MQTKPAPEKYFWLVLIIATILLSIGTTYAQVDDLTFRFIRVHQEKVHQQMLEGVAGNPWQYRILADWMVEPLIHLFVARDIPRPKPSAFIVFRFLQCVLIFLTAGIYYRKLGLSIGANVLGLSVLAWGMAHSLYNSDLALNNFFDVAFYLVAAIIMMNGKFAWIPLLMIPAALNRETSILIPFMSISYVYFNDRKSLQPAIFSTGLSLGIFLLIFVWLRLHYGEQQFLTADGYYPGFGLLVLNLSRVVTWEQLLITLGLIPFLAIAFYRKWHGALKIYFWVVTPLWFAVHFIAALVAETRLVLVPQALIFIPGALFGIMAAGQSSDQGRAQA
jgi:hypothetical protein